MVKKVISSGKKVEQHRLMPLRDIAYYAIMKYFAASEII